MIKKQIEIELGYGDVGILPCVRTDGKEVALFFMNEDMPRKIGAKIPTVDFDPSKADVVMTFKNVESIDSVIGQLKAAKKMLKKGGKKK